MIEKVKFERHPELRFMSYFHVLFSESIQYCSFSSSWLDCVILVVCAGIARFVVVSYLLATGEIGFRFLLFIAPEFS